MLIPVRDRAEAAADRGKNDAARQNYNNTGGADRHHRACAGRLWRQLDGVEQQGQRPTACDLRDTAGGKLALSTIEPVAAVEPTAALEPVAALEPATLFALSIATRHYDDIAAERNRR